MFSYSFKTKGPLFKGNIIKPLLDEAIQDAADYGQGLIQDRSPVRTGRLRAGWNNSVTRSSIKIDNPVFYTKYQERRVGMVRRTLPELNTRLKENIVKQTDKLK